MKRFFLLLTTLAWAQVATAVESKHIDDAPKGFIHITGESYGAEVHRYIRANTVVRLEQYSEENDGKVRHYIRLFTTGTSGHLGGSSGAGQGEIRQPFFQIDYATKEEADKVLKRLLELLSAKE